MPWFRSPRTGGVKKSHAAKQRIVQAEKTASAARQPPKAAAIGTASADDRAEPRLMPVVYTPLANAGRCAKRSLTATGISAPASPIPTPIGKVSASTSGAPGAAARSRPNAAMPARQAPIAARVPSRAATCAAGRAKRPMQSTGIVVSSPATACETPRSSSMSGTSGPTPTSCGRRASAARKSAARTAQAFTGGRSP